MRERDIVGSMTILEAVKVVKTLFASDIGTIPRGSIETSLHVTLSYTPTCITLRNKRGLEFNIEKKEDDWVLNDIAKYSSLKEILIEVTTLICEDEINFRLGQK